MTSGKRSVFSLKGPVGGVTIACDSGTLWITQAGDIRDYVVRAGMNFTVPGEGSVAIQLLDSAGVTIRLPDRSAGRLHRLFGKFGLANAGDAARRRNRLLPGLGRSGCCARAGPGSNCAQGGGG